MGKRQKEAWSTKTVRDRTDNRLTVEKVRKMNQEPQKREKDMNREEKI